MFPVMKWVALNVTNNMDQQQKIEQRVQEKRKRENKTDISIGFRWAVNCAIASMPEKDKSKDNWLDIIKSRTQKIQEWDTEYMLDNMPIPKTEETGELPL